MDKQVLSRSRRSCRTMGFTLIELLIVVMVLAILMAVALPLYLGAVKSSERTACRANMQTIANADQAYRARNFPSYTYSTTLSDLNSDLGSTPLCPWTGAYSIVVSDGSQTADNGQVVPTGGLIIQCSLTGHGVYSPSIDSE